MKNRGLLQQLEEVLDLKEPVLRQVRAVHRVLDAVETFVERLNGWVAPPRKGSDATDSLLEYSEIIQIPVHGGKTNDLIKHNGMREPYLFIGVRSSFKLVTGCSHCTETCTVT